MQDPDEKEIPPTDDATGIWEYPYDEEELQELYTCLLYTSPSPRDVEESRMPSSA